MNLIDNLVWRLQFMWEFRTLSTLSWKSSWVTSCYILKSIKFDTSICPYSRARTEARSFRNFFKQTSDDC